MSSADRTLGVEHLPALFGYAFVLTRSRLEAEDLVQETYARACARMDTLRRHESLKSWLMMILRNLWLNQLRERTGRPEMIAVDIAEVSEELRADHSSDPHEAYVRAVERQQVAEALLELRVDFREIVVLREFEGLSYQEMARVLDCPPGTVMSRLGRARAALRALLSQKLAATLNRPDEVSR